MTVQLTVVSRARNKHDSSSHVRVQQLPGVSFFVRVVYFRNTSSPHV